MLRVSLNDEVDRLTTELATMEQRYLSALQLQEQRYTALLSAFKIGFTFEDTILNNASLFNPKLTDDTIRDSGDVPLVVKSTSHTEVNAEGPKVSNIVVTKDDMNLARNVIIKPTTVQLTENYLIDVTDDGKLLRITQPIEVTLPSVQRFDRELCVFRLFNQYGSNIKIICSDLDGTNSGTFGPLKTFTYLPPGATIQIMMYERDPQIKWSCSDTSLEHATKLVTHYTQLTRDDFLGLAPGIFFINMIPGTIPQGSNYQRTFKVPTSVTLLYMTLVDCNVYDGAPPILSITYLIGIRSCNFSPPILMGQYEIVCTRLTGDHPWNPYPSLTFSGTHKFEANNL